MPVMATSCLCDRTASVTVSSHSFTLSSRFSLSICKGILLLLDVVLSGTGGGGGGGSGDSDEESLARVVARVTGRVLVGVVPGMEALVMRTKKKSWSIFFCLL